MNAPPELAALPVGAQLQDTLLVVDVHVRTLENGDPYTILILGNSTGRIPTEPFWLSRSNEVAGVRRGHAVQVIGEIAMYRERRQLKVVSVRHLPAGSVDLTRLLPSVGGTDRYWETLDGWRREITKPRLKAVVDLFYEDDAFRADYERCPGAVHGHHHAALGGLLKHTTEVAAIARAIGRTASSADMQLVLAGVLLHDIGKLEAYRWDALFDFTERGRLIGHVVLGALMLEHRLGEASPQVCTPGERDLLLHMLLSHHGRREWGSPVAPMTLEAEILHWADNASAKTASVAELLGDDENFPEGAVSLPQWGFERRRFYRGTSDWGAASG